MSAVLAGRYALGPLLGAGGMGRVHAAQDVVLDRAVAVKLLVEGEAEEEGARLLREARTAARFQHPCAVAVYDVGEHDGQPFVVMELVDGESLAERLRREGPLPPGEVIPALESVLSALGAAHAAGLVHRDVKPANVLLPPDGPAKLADFGIAKQVWDDSAALTSPGAVLGTPDYLAPEQAAGRPATFAVDLYATGVLAYEALAGAKPFIRSTPLATALAHQHDPVPPLTDAAPGVPEGLAAAVERALAKDPQDRFRSAEEMRDALRAPAPRAAARASTGAPGSRWAWATLGVAALAILGAAATLLGGDEGGPKADELGVEAGAGDEPPEGDEGEGGDDGADDEAAEGTEHADEADGGDDGGSDGGSEDEADGDDDGGSDGGDAEPTSLRELAALIAEDPEVAGEAADDLLEDLLEVSREDDEEDRREDARELIRDIAEWQTDGELAAEVAGVAIGLLEPEGRPGDEALAPLNATFAELAARPGGGGEKHEDLLDDIDSLLGEDDDGKRRREAEKLLDEIDEWEADGELDAEVADEARAALRELAE